MRKQTLIIAAIASRPYVKAAVEAGYKVIAIDCFADEDVKQLASDVYSVTQKNGALNSTQLLKIIANLNSDLTVGFCYGAGLEGAPDVLSDISQYVCVLGNAAEVVSQTKTPQHFFKLCDDLDVSYPEVAFEKPLVTDGWLQKSIGGTGGAHIKFVNDDGAVDTNFYYQKLQNGQPVSCLFLASAGEVVMIGFNEQWVSATIDIPFRYGGAANHADISASAKACFTQYVTKLSQALGLVGLNSCDAICHGDDVVVLEINPRLSASVDLYALKESSLLTMHVAACQGDFLGDYQQIHDLVQASSQAHQIIYAKCDTLVSTTHHWPTWVSDIPKSGEHFTAGMPICTVSAEAEIAVLAKELVQARAVLFQDKLLV